MMQITSNTILDPAAMRARKQAYFDFVRRLAPLYFTQDGQYKPGVEPDYRMTHWLFPVLVTSPDPAIKELGINLYLRTGVWEGWNIFTTSSITANLVREKAHMTPELIRRSEEHIAQFSDNVDGHVASSGANDYMFHGYNDNMPAMAMRNMILAGEYLGNQALIDHGLFRLEGLCAHFERRGLLAEYNSGTYTAITLTSLLDVVECSQDATTREMAQACAERVLLDIFGHWHMGLGCSSGPKSRAYLPDADNTQSIMPGLMWYLTGDPLIINPMDSLSSEGVGITLHHGPSPAFMMANIAELFSPSYDPISPAVLEFCRAERTYPHQLLATSDSGKTSYSLLRTYQQPKWGLGTSSCAMWGPGSGHNLTLHGVLTQKDEPTDWRGRVSFWHYMFSEYPDLGDRIPSGYDDTMVETTSMQDPGQYHTAQQAGSALVLGNLGTGLIGKETKKLRFQMAFSLLGTMPDEMLVNDTPLAAWEGDASAADWHFLRFGQVFVGLRMAGMLKDAALPVRRELRAGYLRVEIPIVESPTVIDEEFQAWLDLGYVLEIADASECSFAEFRQQCQAATWEYFHAFYRNSRYIGRHGELQIVDSIVPNTLRFIAVDGTVEEMPRFTATGLDPAAVQLFADGHIVRQRRLLFRPQFAGSPFYNSHNHVLAADIE